MKIYLLDFVTYFDQLHLLVLVHNKRPIRILLKCNISIYHPDEDRFKLFVYRFTEKSQLAIDPISFVFLFPNHLECVEL